MLLAALALHVELRQRAFDRVAQQHDPAHCRVVAGDACDHARVDQVERRGVAMQGARIIVSVEVARVALVELRDERAHVVARAPLLSAANDIASVEQDGDCFVPVRIG